MSRIRGFELVENWARKNSLERQIVMPYRSTKYSAGYDFVLCKDIILKPNVPYIYWTDIKAYMLPDEFLEVFIRSSIAIKKRIILTNQTGIVDQDYYNNPDNDGNIGICLLNLSKEEKQLNADEKIAQGVFTKYLIVDHEKEITNNRTGGVGSTG